MKSFIPSILEGMFSLIGALSIGKEALFPHSSFINEDFIDQFDKKEDRDLLNKTVTYLKSSKIKSQEITLSNNRKIKIVVD